MLLFWLSVSFALSYLSFHYGWFWLCDVALQAIVSISCARGDGIVIESPHDCDNSCTELVAHLKRKFLRCDMHVVALLLSFQSHHTELVRILCFHLENNSNNCLLVCLQAQRFASSSVLLFIFIWSLSLAFVSVCVCRNSFFAIHLSFSVVNYMYISSQQTCRLPFI